MRVIAEGLPDPVDGAGPLGDEGDDRPVFPIRRLQVEGDGQRRRSGGGVGAAAHVGGNRRFGYSRDRWGWRRVRGGFGVDLTWRSTPLG